MLVLVLGPSSSNASVLCRSLFAYNPGLMYERLVNHPGLNKEGVHESVSINKASCGMTTPKSVPVAYEAVIALFHSLQFSHAGS